MSDYSELKRLAEHHLSLGQAYTVAKPSVLLALIADNERLTAAIGSQAIRRFVGQDDQKKMDELVSAGIQVDKDRIAQLETERDQLKAENDQLFGETERLKAENERLQKLISWQGEGNNKVEVNAGPLMKHMDERDQLRAEVAGLRTSYEAYQQVNAELKAENELARMRIKEMDLLFGRYILAMRSALIEEEHGKGPAAAMQWIYNSLAGPGELPPEGETDSQAYFDREIVAVDDGMQEVMAFHDGRRAALVQGEQS